MNVSVDVETDVELGATVDEALIQCAVREAFLIGTRSSAAPLLPDPGIADEWTVSVLVAGDDEMQRLNRDFRGVDKPTDVLSFSMLEGDDVALPGEAAAPLGEIALSYPYLKRQARELGHSLEKELVWLVIHGTLQLIGYTHETDEKAQHMEGLEQEALGRVNVVESENRLA